MSSLRKLIFSYYFIYQYILVPLLIELLDSVGFKLREAGMNPFIIMGYQLKTQK